MRCARRSSKGRLAPGARLIERELIQMTGVSRTVIREALRQLELEGVVATIPNKGPVVRQLTLDEAKDLYLIRGVLEGLAAKMFVGKASEADLAELKVALDDTVAAYRDGDPDIVLNAKNRFYETLTRGAGSEILSQMLATLHARIRRWRALGLGHPKRSSTRSRESVKGLRDMFDAVQAARRRRGGGYCPPRGGECGRGDHAHPRQSRGPRGELAPSVAKARQRARPTPHGAWEAGELTHRVTESLGRDLLA